MQRASIVGERGVAALPLVVFRTADLASAVRRNGNGPH